MKKTEIQGMCEIINLSFLRILVSSSSSPFLLASDIFSSSFLLFFSGERLLFLFLNFFSLLFFFFGENFGETVFCSSSFFFFYSFLHSFFSGVTNFGQKPHTNSSFERRIIWEGSKKERVRAREMKKRRKSKNKMTFLHYFGNFLLEYDVGRMPFVIFSKKSVVYHFRPKFYFIRRNFPWIVYNNV